MSQSKNISQIILILLSSILLFHLYGILTAALVTTALFTFLFYKNFANIKKDQITSILAKKEEDDINIENTLDKTLFHSSISNIPVITIVFLFLLAHFLSIRTNVSFDAIKQGIPVAKELTNGLLNPNWNLLGEAVTVYARQTIEVALLGTIIAFFISLPISFFCSWNLMNKNILTQSLYYIIRSVVVIIRAIPTFLLGLIFVALVGLGSFPGVLAIIIFSSGIMVKLFSESIESINNQTTEAVSASGGNMLHVIVFAVIPESLPIIISQTLYCAEINIHSATVLGLVGAEGIGLPIHEYLSMLSYSNAATFIFVTIIMTLVIDQISVFSRKKIIGNTNL